MRKTAIVVLTLTLILAMSGSPPSAAEAASSRWIARPPLDHARSGLGVVAIDRHILAIGGWDSSNVFDYVEARRVSGRGRWRDLSPMPTARVNLAAAVSGGLVYTIGGFSDVDVESVVETFDPNTGLWATGVPLPQPRAFAGAAGLRHTVYVAGGLILLENGEEITNSTLAYDHKANAWRPVAPMPTARGGVRLVAAEGYLYAIGGTDPTGASLTTVERYDPGSDSWVTIAPMAESRSLPCAVPTRVGGRTVLVVVAGIEFAADGTFVNARRTTKVFDIETGEWTLLDVLLPEVRGSHDCAVEANGTVLAIGGATNTGGPPIHLTDIDALKLRPSDLR
jgi:hypothetical protein